MNNLTTSLKILKDAYADHSCNVDAEGICGACSALHEQLDSLRYEVEQKLVDHIDGLNGWEESEAIKITNSEANELLKEIDEFKNKI